MICEFAPHRLHLSAIAFYRLARKESLLPAMAHG